MGKQSRKRKRDDFQIAALQGGIITALPGDTLMHQCESLLSQAARQAKQDRFRWLVRRLPLEVLTSIQAAAADSGDVPTEGAALLVYLGCATYALLHGEPSRPGLIRMAESSAGQWARQIGPCLTMELLRRKGCLEDLDLPADPFAPDAKVGVLPSKRTLEAFREGTIQ